MDNHLEAKKKAAMKKMESICHQDENERELYSRNKRLHRDLVEEKKAKKEEANKAVKLASLHYILMLLKRCMIDYWKGYMQVIKVKNCKALTFRRDAVIYKC